MNKEVAIEEALLDRARGVLLGQLAGDALGLAEELLRAGASP